MRKFLLFIFNCFLLFDIQGQTCADGSTPTTVTLDLTGLLAVGDNNASGNSTGTVCFPGGSLVNVVGDVWDNLTITTSNGSYCNEAAIQAGNMSDASGGWAYTFFTANNTGPCGTASFPFFNYDIDGDGSWSSDANGCIHFEIYDTFNDTGTDFTFNSGSITFYACPAGIPLPIKISNIKASESGKLNLIIWSTSSEINNDIQQVERSIDGISNWETVGKVAGTNTNSEQTYQVIDDKPFQKSYYRIKSIDFDGKIQLSDIVSVFRDGEKGSIDRIHPNPTFNNLQIDFEPLYDDELTYAVYNADGKLMKSFIFQGISGKSNTHLLDISSLNTGFYFVKIKGGGINHNAKIFKI